MAIFNALVVTAFLLLLAASAAVVGSMILLTLFDWAFGKKSKLQIAAEMTEQDTEMMESDELDKPPPKPEAEVTNSKPKPERVWRDATQWISSVRIHYNPAQL
jgi:hypothetical protein